MSELSDEQRELLDTLHAWTQKADEDLAASEYLINSGYSTVYRPAAFSAQQCVEKYLKALLVSRGHHAPKMHDLERLYKLAKESGGIPQGMPLVQEISVLNRYAVSARYPDDLEPVIESEARKALALAKQVRQSLEHILPPEISDTTDSSDN
jgi:HEPN domain-containing protein